MLPEILITGGPLDDSVSRGEKMIAAIHGARHVLLGSMARTAWLSVRAKNARTDVTKEAGKR